MRNFSTVLASRAQARFVFAVIATLVMFGCSSSTSGCSGMTPIPTGRYAGVKNDNAVNVRITGNGITYINSNWQSLVEAFAPGGHLDVSIPCTKLSGVPVIGDVYVADQGNASGSGKLDGQCDGQDLPAKVAVTITSFKLLPQAPDKISAEIAVNIDTGKIFAQNPHSLCDLKCSLVYNNSPQGNAFATVIRFTVDTKWDKLLAFDIASIDGTDVCGASGAPPKPRCLDPDQINLSRESGFCGFACDAADWAPVKDFVLKFASPLIQKQIEAAAKSQSCQSCGAGKPGCPQLANAASTCVNSGDGAACSGTSCYCKDTATNICVPRLLGVEGRVSVAPLLASFGVAGDAAMDLSVALGSSATIDQGISLGTRVGVQAVTVAGCVTPQPSPSILTVPAPNFDGEATPGSMYHVGLGISSSFLNVAFHQAQQAGALCLQLGTANVGLINTGLFKTFLPSLGRLATRDGKDAPMMVALRPGRAPLVTVGLGTYDPVTKRPIKPLLTMSLPELSIDIYALIDDRYARLFTLTADVALPMSLIFEGCDKVSPALGDLKMLVTNIKTSNSELLAEDPKVLEDLIPAVIGLAEPALASLLQPFALPTLGSFKMKVNETKGIGNIAGSEAYNHLGIYATLLPSGATCAVSAPRTVVSLKETVMPKAAEMRLAGHALPWPKAILDVKALGKDGSPEFAYKIDDGMWSTFLVATDGLLEVSHPRFLLQGTHTIWVRSRVSEDQHGISAPEQISFVVDWDAPTVSLTADPSADRVMVTAHDVVTADTALQYAYAVGKGGFGAFGPAREVSLSAVEAQGGVTVQVRDELGNVGEATYRAPTVALRADSEGADSVSHTMPLAGCSSVGGLEVLGLLALAAIRRRRS